MNNKELFLDECRTNVKRAGIDKLLDWLENKSDFFTSPASTKYHGNYEGGLCEHSRNVFRELRRFNDIYDLHYPIETLAIVGLLHDVCKANFYKRGTRNVKDENGTWVTVDVWEIDDRLPLGHGEKSCIILQKYHSR